MKLHKKSVPRVRGGVALAVLSVAILAGCKPASKESPTPPVVKVATVTRGDPTIYQEWIGTLDGLVNAQIRAQVTGYLLAQDYHEGDRIKKGDLLFEIDARPFQVALDHANGMLKQAEARFGKTQLDVKRYAPLVKDKAISQEEYDNAVQANLEAEAAMVSAKADVEQAQLNLEFTKIVSPIDGVPNFAKAQIGDLVGQSSGELTTVSTVDPIKAYFSVTEQEYVDFTRNFTTDSARSEQIKHVDAELILPDGTAYPLRGKIVALDRSVGLTTGALRVEALFPNPNNALRPGQFARVRVKADSKPDTVLAPCRAVSELQGSYQVAVVYADNKVHMQPVQIGERSGNQFIIESGLQPGQRVVVEGLQKVRDGAMVTATNYVDEVPAQPASTH
jgi:membrane fusion protein (multidrug efflux system)